jgi:hypothetical protein
MPYLQTGLAAATSAQSSPEPAGDLPKQLQQGDGNVISLAQRIRALQTDLTRK